MCVLIIRLDPNLERIDEVEENSNKITKMYVYYISYICILTHNVYIEPEWGPYPISKPPRGCLSEAKKE